MTNRNQPNLSPASLSLFLLLARSAGDWGGQPLFDGTNAERGNLTHLKIAGLLTTFSDEGCSFVQFTEAGKALAATNEIDLQI